MGHDKENIAEVEKYRGRIPPRATPTGIFRLSGRTLDAGDPHVLNLRPRLVFMAFVEYVPGMRTGATVRNIILGIVYVLLLPLLSTLAFVWVPVYVGVNYNGIAKDLSSVPGISPDGGLRTAVVAFLYMIVISLGPRIVGWLIGI
jgi:hypothetical protein